MNHGIALLLLLGSLAGCGAASSPSPRPEPGPPAQGDVRLYAASTDAAEPIATGARPNEASFERPTRNPTRFDVGAASQALVQASQVAARCVPATEPRGNCKVVTTFGNDGRANHVEVRPPCATRDAACMEAAFMAASVPAFEGAPVSVSRSVQWGK